MEDSSFSSAWQLPSAFITRQTQISQISMLHSCIPFHRIRNAKFSKCTRNLRKALILLMAICENSWPFSCSFAQTSLAALVTLVSRLLKSANTSPVMGLMFPRAMPNAFSLDMDLHVCQGLKYFGSIPTEHISTNAMKIIHVSYEPRVNSKSSRKFWGHFPFSFRYRENT